MSSHRQGANLELPPSDASALNEPVAFSESKSEHESLSETHTHHEDKMGGKGEDSPREVTWDGDRDPENPRNWPKWKKWYA